MQPAFQWTVVLVEELNGHRTGLEAVPGCRRNGFGVLHQFVELGEELFRHFLLVVFHRLTELGKIITGHLTPIRLSKIGFHIVPNIVQRLFGTAVLPGFLQLLFLLFIPFLEVLTERLGLVNAGILLVVQPVLQISQRGSGYATQRLELLVEVFLIVVIQLDHALGHIFRQRSHLIIQLLGGINATAQRVVQPTGSLLQGELLRLVRVQRTIAGCRCLHTSRISRFRRRQLLLSFSLVYLLSLRSDCLDALLEFRALGAQCVQRLRTSLPCTFAFSLTLLRLFLTLFKRTEFGGQHFD